MRSVFRFELERILPSLLRGKHERVVNLGAGLIDYREMVDCGEFVRVDCNDAFAPDVVASASRTGLEPGSFDLVLCTQLLEHVQEPQEVVDEAFYLLKPHGRCVFSVPFFEVFHGEEGCDDYWRFTRRGLACLFEEFEEVEVIPVGSSLQSFFYFFNGIRLLRVFNPLFSVLRWGRNAPMGFVVSARKGEN